MEERDLNLESPKAVVLEIESLKGLEALIKGKGRLVVDYYSPTCPPCRAMVPAYDAVAAKYCDQVAFARIDAWEIPVGQNIGAVPTVIAYKMGHEVKRVVGLQSEQGLLSFVQGLLD